jgi:hypothetical protein
MVRRHRLRDEEIGYVMKAVHLRLGELLEGNEFNVETETLFRVLWRFTHHRRGPPGYPEITPNVIEWLLTESSDLRSL